MKKILCVFDGSHYSENVLQFISLLNNLNPVSVTGLFLSAYDYSHLWSNPIIQDIPEALTMAKETMAIADKDIEENKSRFERFCIKEGIPWRVHDESGNDVFETLRHETRFADLMILSNDLFYHNIGENPNDYMQQILHAGECAVLILPEKENFPKQIILCYDGTASSVFAIKQFAYILPELCHCETFLVSIDGEENRIPLHALMEELAVRHFPKLTMQVMGNDARNKFAGWVNAQSHPLVVAGAFGRSGFSRLLKKSFISEVIKENKATVFIAHK
jgi:hypothetical protein